MTKKNNKENFQEEIDKLKIQISELEKKLSSFKKEKNKTFQSRTPRVKMDAEIEAIGDFDIFSAKGIEI